MKYTKEELEKYVKESIYLSDMIRKMGMNPNSGNNRYLAKRIKLFEIDTSHWLSASEKGRICNKSSFRKKTATEVLLKYETNKPGTALLRRAMFESGIIYQCSECKIGPEYNNKPLVIQIDHINGNNLDNRLENLRFLCPNCHSQTDNFMVKNSTKIKNEKTVKQTEKCSCGNIKSIFSTNCNKCYDTNRGKHIPSKEVLQLAVWSRPTSHIAKEYGVSDKAVEKWCKKYGIIKPSRGYWSRLKFGKLQ